jgi:hypothetical protein
MAYAGDTLPDGTVVGGNKLYPYIPLSTRAERKKQLVEQDVVFEKAKPKHRYVGIYAPNRRIKRAILGALRWKNFPYPKRAQSPEDRVQIVDNYCGNFYGKKRVRILASRTDIRIYPDRYQPTRTETPIAAQQVNFVLCGVFGVRA